MKPFHVTVRLRNNCLLQRREELGLSPRQLAEAAGVCYPTYLGLESMRISPMSKGEWRSSALKIAAFHGISADELWPDAVLSVVAASATRILDEDEIASLGGGRAVDQHALAEDHERAAHVREALATLTPRQEKVLRMRFGIGEKSDHTLEEVGQDFELSRERIRAIEARGITKLRSGLIGADNDRRLIRRRIGEWADVEDPDHPALCKSDPVTDDPS